VNGEITRVPPLMMLELSLIELSNPARTSHPAGSQSLRYSVRELMAAALI
jgi:hypothetical protein